MEFLSPFFASVDDPRAPNARHDFMTVLFIALFAVLCGAESCSDMADFGQSKEKLLRKCLKLPHGVPSHDTFSRVFRILDAEAFAGAFARFAKSFAIKLAGGKLEGVVAIDGKTVRGAFERGARSSPLHLVNVWACEARLVIGQQLSPGRNEVQGAINALKLLSLEGCIVTADALHCRADTAEAILAKGADYVLALKDNQRPLRAAAEALLCPKHERDEDLPAHHCPQIDTAKAEAEHAHDRTEIRKASVAEASHLAFPGIAAVARIETTRQMQDGTKDCVIRYFALSRKWQPARVLEIARAHWGIENQLHWVLDVALHEDAARNRKDNGPQNLAIIRKIALNILRTHPDKASIRRKIKKAGWDDAFLLSLVTHMR